jgi:hypothetical protein
MNRLTERAQGSRKIMIEPMKITKTPMETPTDQSRAESRLKIAP